MEGESEAKKTRVRIDVTRGGPERLVGILVISVEALSGFAFSSALYFMAQFY